MYDIQIRLTLRTYLFKKKKKKKIWDVRYGQKDLQPGQDFR